MSKKKEMSTIEKVKLMNSLAEIATDEALEATIKEKKHGDVVYDIFIEAVDSKLKEIMDGKAAVKEQNENMVSVLAATGRMEITIQELQRLVVNFAQTPLMQVLTTLNENLGGKKFELNRELIDSANAATVSVPQPIRQQPQQPQRQPQQPQTQQEQPTAYNPPARGGGLGSF